MIISVGYRVNSRQGTQFRIWATQVLRDHILHGTTGTARFELTYEAAMDAIALFTTHHSQLTPPSLCMILSPMILSIFMSNHHGGKGLPPSNINPSSCRFINPSLSMEGRNPLRPQAS